MTGFGRPKRPSQGRDQRANAPRESTATARAGQTHWPDEHGAAKQRLTDIHSELRLNVGERKRLEREAVGVERGLREVQERFESAFNNAPIGMALLDMDGHWIQVNDALCGIIGHTATELQATTLRAVTHPDDLDLDADMFEQLQQGEIANYQIEKRYRHAWGHHVWVLVTASIVRDGDRRPLHIVTQVQDISERKQMAQQLEYIVDHDFLTGLLNRRHFEQELAREAARAARYDAPGAVLLIDIDNFKDVNDTYGHRAGDDVLKGVAGLLRERLRHTDLIARVGGDEFAVLLTQTKADEVQVVADEVVKALGKHAAVIEGKTIRITASVGVAMLEGQTDVDVLAFADLAMHEAKESGRDRFEMYRPLQGGRERASSRLAEAERIRRAVEENRMQLHCQPIIDLTTRQVRQYELLLRLPSADGEDLLLPSAFLYRAERSGLIQAIDAWVARRAIALIAEHERAGHELVLGVNLSGKSIGDRRLAAQIESALTDSGIDPSRLVFELTETAAISNFEDARAFASRLHARGCRFALDDFGVGFGSFHYLKSFRFDFLKIDGDFIRDITTSPMNQLLVSAIVGIARGMGKQTVAEFVGTEEAAQLLRGLGVDFAQGYHFGKPRPVSAVLESTAASPSLDARVGDLVPE